MGKLSLRRDPSSGTQQDLQPSLTELQPVLSRAEFCAWPLPVSQPSLWDEHSSPAKSNASLNISLPLSHLRAFSPAWNDFLSSVCQLQSLCLPSRAASSTKTFSFPPVSLPLSLEALGPGFGAAPSPAPPPAATARPSIPSVRVPGRFWPFLTASLSPFLLCPPTEVPFTPSYLPQIQNPAESHLQEASPDFPNPRLDPWRRPSSVRQWDSEETSVLNKVVHSFIRSFIMARWKILGQTTEVRTPVSE